MEERFNIYEATEEEIVAFIDEYNDFTEKEIKHLLYAGYEVDRACGDNRRWTRSVSSVFEIGGRYFGIEWEQGLTECQDDYFPTTTLEELEPFEEVKVVKGWKRKNVN
jgi:hypothetical protein